MMKMMTMMMMMIIIMMKTKMMTKKKEKSNARSRDDLLSKIDYSIACSEWLVLKKGGESESMRE